MRVNYNRHCLKPSTVAKTQQRWSHMTFFKGCKHDRESVKVSQPHRLIEVLSALWVKLDLCACSVAISRACSSHIQPREPGCVFLSTWVVDGLHLGGSALVQRTRLAYRHGRRQRCGISFARQKLEHCSPSKESAFFSCFRVPAAALDKPEERDGYVQVVCQVAPEQK